VGAEEARPDAVAVPVSVSRTVRSELVFPNDANPQGNIFGGRVLMLMDVVGAIAARRHSRRQVVTAEIDSVHFLRPIRVGECIELVAEVSAVGRTSMEVEVHAYVEDLFTGQHATSATAYLTYVALDDGGRPTAVPPLRPETPEQQARMLAAAERRRERLARRQRMATDGAGDA
jgi:acyl-CoA hydrolase